MSTLDRLTGASSSLAFKAPVRLATTANLSSLSGYQTIDGELPTSSEHPDLRRILVKNQTSAKDNGIYIMDTGPWERARDFDSVHDFRQGTRIYVYGGSSQSGGYVVANAVNPLTFVVGTNSITFATASLSDLSSSVQDVRDLLGIGDPPAPQGGVIPRTCWLEMDGLFQPGIITRETSGGTASLTEDYVREKLTALYHQGYRRFIIQGLTHNGRTYTDWGITTPVDPSGTTFDWWRDDVAASVKPNVDDIDPLEIIVEILNTLEGTQLIVGLGQHDDVNLLNDLFSVTFSGGVDPLRFSKTVTVRLNEEIQRYEDEAADVVDRFGARRCFAGFYISHESDHLQSSDDLYTPVADDLRQYGEVHISVATPTDFADSNTIADAINSYHVDWIWPQTSAGYGYNWSTGVNAYVGAITIFGSAAHYATWRDLLDRARGRTAGAYTPKLGGHVENWRIGVQGSGTLTFAATSGNNVEVTLGTSSSVVSADVGKDIYVRADQATGIARVVSITDTTHIRVNITENLADVDVGAGLWAIVPDLTDSTIDAYPAPANEVAIEIATIGGYCDDVSVYGEAYWDPGNLSLRLKESQGPVTDYRTRALDGWTDHAVNLSRADRVARFFGWNNRDIEDPGADRILFWDHTGGAGSEGTFAFLSLPAAGITISGTSLALANDLSALEGLSSTGIAVRTASDTWAQRSLANASAGLTWTNADGVSGNPTPVFANDLGALEALSSTGIAVRTTTDTWAQRSLSQPAAGLTITNPAGIAGDPTFALANDLAALEGLGSTGFAVRSGSDTWVQRTFANASAGLTWTNGTGVSGNPTPVFANDLGAIEALNSTGLLVRTAADTWAQRAATGTAGQIDVANGDGVSGNPTFSLPGALTGRTSMNTGPLAGLRNRLINGAMRWNHRGAATNADDTYAFDRWNILTQTGTVAVTAVSDIEDGWPIAMRITQSQASAQRFGAEQIIESFNCKDLRGQAVTLSARVRCSNSTTLRYAILEWTGTANTVTSDVVNDWTSATFTAGNFFNSTTLTVTATGSTALTANTAATVSLSTTLGSSANNVIVFFWTDSTQAQNSTLDIGKVQFEIGASATAFESIPLSLDEELCKRYFRPIPRGTYGQAEDTAIVMMGVSFVPAMRTTPTITLLDTSPSFNNAGGFTVTNTDNDSAIASSGVSADGGFIRINGFDGANALVATYPYILANSTTLTADAEL